MINKHNTKKITHIIDNADRNNDTYVWRIVAEIKKLLIQVVSSTLRFYINSLNSIFIPNTIYGFQLIFP